MRTFKNTTIRIFELWIITIVTSFYLCLHSNRLKCRDGGLGFGVEVIKHEQTDLAAVLLYLNNQHIVAAAYSVDNDQLPRSTQASLVFSSQHSCRHTLCVLNTRIGRRITSASAKSQRRSRTDHVCIT